MVSTHWSTQKTFTYELLCLKRLSKLTKVELLVRIYTGRYDEVIYQSTPWFLWNVYIKLIEVKWDKSKLFTSWLFQSSGSGKTCLLRYSVTSYSSVKAFPPMVFPAWYAEKIRSLSTSITICRPIIYKKYNQMFLKVVHKAFQLCELHSMIYID